MKVLHLNLRRKWFDMIRSGEKPEEYRRICDYWKKRLWLRDYDVIEFRNGYTKNAPRFRVPFIGVHLGNGRIEWGAEECGVYYVVRFGEVAKETVRKEQLRVETSKGPQP